VIEVQMLKEMLRVDSSDRYRRDSKRVERIEIKDIGTTMKCVEIEPINFDVRPAADIQLQPVPARYCATKSAAKVKFGNHFLSEVLYGTAQAPKLHTKTMSHHCPPLTF
jgi:hypothetical protein